jgi:hypothetical protein
MYIFGILLDIAIVYIHKQHPVHIAHKIEKKQFLRLHAHEWALQTNGLAFSSSS